MKKKILLSLAIILVVSLTLSLTSFGATTNKAVPFNDFTLVYNGQEQTFEKENPPVNLNGRTMLPLVYMFNLVNEDKSGTVDWDGTARMVTFSYNGKTVKLWIDNPTAEVNGQKVSVGDANPIIYNSRTYVPMSFVATNFDLSVGWDPIARTASVIEKAKLEEIATLFEKAEQEYSSSTKHSCDIETETNVVITADGETEELLSISKVKMEQDSSKKYSHVVGTNVTGKIISNLEIYDDGTYTYIIDGTDIMKEPSSLSVGQEMEFLSGNDNDANDPNTYALLTADNGNKVIVCSMYLTEETYQERVEDFLSGIIAGYDIPASAVEYKINAITQMDMLYEINKTTGNYESMYTSYGVDFDVNIAGEKMNVVMEVDMEITNIKSGATFNTTIPDSVKNKAKSI